MEVYQLYWWLHITAVPKNTMEIDGAHQCPIMPLFSILFSCILTRENSWNFHDIPCISIPFWKIRSRKDAFSYQVTLSIVWTMSIAAAHCPRPCRRSRGSRLQLKMPTVKRIRSSGWPCLKHCDSPLHKCHKRPTTLWLFNEIFMLDGEYILPCYPCSIGTSGPKWVFFHGSEGYPPANHSAGATLRCGTFSQSLTQRHGMHLPRVYPLIPVADSHWWG